MSFWNNRKYPNYDVGGAASADGASTLGGLDRTMVRATDAMAQHGFVIGFQHVPTERRVSFKAFITAFNETYKSNWNSETVFGRGDPIHMFKNTERTISLGWKIPAATIGEGYENLFKLQQFLQFLYPTYTDANHAQTINQSPLVRLELMNLVRSRDSAEGEGWEKYETPYFHLDNQDFGLSTDWSVNAVAAGVNGLLGVINSVDIAHNLDTDIGVFERGITATNDGDGSSARVLPKMIEVQISFSVIHEHPMGWQDKKFGSEDGHGRYFPYGINGEDGEEDTSGGFLGGGGAAYSEFWRAQEAEAPENEEDDLNEEEPVEASAEAEAQSIAGQMSTVSTTLKNGAVTTTTETKNPDGSVTRTSTISINTTPSDVKAADALESEGKGLLYGRRK